MPSRSKTRLVVESYYHLCSLLVVKLLQWDKLKVEFLRVVFFGLSVYYLSNYLSKDGSLEVFL